MDILHPHQNSIMELMKRMDVLCVTYPIKFGAERNYLMVQIPVVIEKTLEGTTCLTTFRNVWDFVYCQESRILFLTRYCKYYKQSTDNVWHTDVKVLPGYDDDCEAKLAEALGPDLDKQKVLLIAKAKCLESDIYMRVNELDCIEVRWWQPTQIRTTD